MRPTRLPTTQSSDAGSPDVPAADSDADAPTGEDAPSEG